MTNEKKSILNEKELKNIVSMEEKHLCKEKRSENYFCDTKNPDLEEVDFLRGFENLDNLQEMYNDVPRAFMMSQKEHNSKILPKFGEIWSVDLSFGVGSEIRNTRPCIIFSKKRGNNVTIIPITSNTKPYETHVQIEEDFFVDIQKKTVGAVKCEAIRSVSVARLGDRLGRLSNKGLKQTLKTLLLHLNLYFLLRIDELDDEDIEDFNKFEQKM